MKGFTFTLPFNLFHRNGGWIFYDLRHFSAPEPDDPVSHGRQRRIMGNNDDRHMLLAAGILQKLKNLFARIVVKSACWFITE